MLEDGALSNTYYDLIKGHYCSIKNMIEYYKLNSYVDIIKNNGYTKGELAKLIKEIIGACQLILWSFTGLRPHEFYTIPIDIPVEIKNNQYYIFANRTKGKDLKLSLFQDEFVAIPIMIDAYYTLQEIGKNFGHSYLIYGVHFGRLQTHAIRTVGLPGGMVHVINAILGERAVSILKLYPYIFRHNLVYQLDRVRLELPYISYQMGHLVDSIDQINNFSETTLAYGGLQDKYQKLNICIENLSSSNNSPEMDNLFEAASLEKIKNMYDPDGAYVGGGAEKHLEKVKRFFFWSYIRRPF